MPQVVFAPAALCDLKRLREFLRQKDPAAAKRAAATIIKGIDMLAEHPQLGRHPEEMDAEYRELPIGFGATGYVALYRYENDTVTVLALRHQKEAGY
jgi:plasmid stabilization system protein ParE